MVVEPVTRKTRDRNDSSRVAKALKECTKALYGLTPPEQLRVLAGLRAYVNTPDGFVRR